MIKRPCRSWQSVSNSLIIIPDTPLFLQKSLKITQPSETKYFGFRRPAYPTHQYNNFNLSEINRRRAKAPQEIVVIDVLGYAGLSETENTWVSEDLLLIFQ